MNEISETKVKHTAKLYSRQQTDIKRKFSGFGEDEDIERLSIKAVKKSRKALRKMNYLGLIDNPRAEKLPKISNKSKIIHRKEEDKFESYMNDPRHMYDWKPLQVYLFFSKHIYSLKYRLYFNKLLKILGLLPFGEGMNKDFSNIEKLASEGPQPLKSLYKFTWCIIVFLLIFIRILRNFFFVDHSEARIDNISWGIIQLPNVSFMFFFIYTFSNHQIFKQLAFHLDEVVYIIYPQYSDDSERKNVVRRVLMRKRLQTTSKRLLIIWICFSLFCSFFLIASNNAARLPKMFKLECVKSVCDTDEDTYLMNHYGYLYVLIFILSEFMLILTPIIGYGIILWCIQLVGNLCTIILREFDDDERTLSIQQIDLFKLYHNSLQNILEKIMKYAFVPHFIIAFSCSFIFFVIQTIRLVDTNGGEPSRGVFLNAGINIVAFCMILNTWPVTKKKLDILSSFMKDLRNETKATIRIEAMNPNNELLERRVSASILDDSQFDFDSRNRKISSSVVLKQQQSKRKNRAQSVMVSSSSTSHIKLDAFKRSKTTPMKELHEFHASTVDESIQIYLKLLLYCAIGIILVVIYYSIRVSISFNDCWYGYYDNDNYGGVIHSERDTCSTTMEIIGQIEASIANCFVNSGPLLFCFILLSNIPKNLIIVQLSLILSAFIGRIIFIINGQFRLGVICFAIAFVLELIHLYWYLSKQMKMQQNIFPKQFVYVFLSTAFIWLGNIYIATPNFVGDTVKNQSNNNNEGVKLALIVLFLPVANSIYVLQLTHSAQQMQRVRHELKQDPYFLVSLAYLSTLIWNRLFLTQLSISNQIFAVAVLLTIEVIVRSLNPFLYYARKFIAHLFSDNQRTYNMSAGDLALTDMDHYCANEMFAEIIWQKMVGELFAILTVISFMIVTKLLVSAKTNHIQFSDLFISLLIQIIGETLADIVSINIEERMQQRSITKVGASKLLEYVKNMIIPALLLIAFATKEWRYIIEST